MTSCDGAVSALFSGILLLRSRGVRPRLFLISALFNQNSSIKSVFFDGVSSLKDSVDLEDSDAVFSVLFIGVEVTAGTG